MKKITTLGLIGDYNALRTAHQAIPIALKLVSEVLQEEIRFEWVPTAEITSDSRIQAYDGLWCVPGSPYVNMEGAVLAIRYARESGQPFLGTCGGFQHMVVEYARNVLGWADADPGETASRGGRLVISALACSMVEVTDQVRLFANTKIREAYGAVEANEGYRCNYGMNPEFRTALTDGPLRASADDATGEVRAAELDDHPFFVATLFQPERTALKGVAPPLVTAFVRAAAM